MTVSNSLTSPDLRFLICKTQRLGEVSSGPFLALKLNPVVSGKQGLPFTMKGLKSMADLKLA